MPNRSGITPAVVYIALLVAAAAAYAPSFDNGFREDDFVFLSHAVESAGVSGWVRPSPDFAFYRPGAVVLFGLETALFGAHAGAYLAFNFFIHALTSLGLLFFLKRVTPDRGAGALAAGLFVLGVGHYGKQVMWACASGPLAAVLLVVCALWATAAYLDAPGRRRRYLAAAAGALFLAPSFHELGLAGPVLVVLFALAKAPAERKVRWPFAGLAGAAVVVWAAAYVAVSQGHESYRRAAGMAARAPAALFDYLGFMFLPIQPSELVAHQPGIVGRVAEFSGPIHAVVAAGVVFASAALLVKGPRMGRFLVAWVYVALLPFCFIRLPQGWLELRYLYFAAAPVCALLAMGLSRAFADERRTPRWAAAAIVIVAAAMSFYVVRTLEGQYDRQAKDPRNRARFEAVHRALRGG